MRKIRVMVISSFQDLADDYVFLCELEGHNAIAVTDMTQVLPSVEVYQPDLIIIQWYNATDTDRFVRWFAGQFPIILISTFPYSDDVKLQSHLFGFRCYSMPMTIDEIDNMVQEIERLSAPLRADLEWLDLNPTK